MWPKVYKNMRHFSSKMCCLLSIGVWLFILNRRLFGCCRTLQWNTLVPALIAKIGLLIQRRLFNTIPWFVVSSSKNNLSFSFLKKNHTNAYSCKLPYLKQTLRQQQPGFYVTENDTQMILDFNEKFLNLQRYKSCNMGCCWRPCRRISTRLLSE